MGFDVEEYTKKYGKPDIERLGLFIEMPYLARGKPKPQNRGGEYLRRMLAGGPKTKCGTMDGYFEEKFIRIFNGERKKPRTVDHLLAGKLPFIPCGPSKKHSTPGDYYGTFGGRIAEFSPKLRPQPKQVITKPNPVTNPGKKGGPGYVNITIGKYPVHMNERPKKIPTEKKAIVPMVAGTHPKPYFYPNPFRDPEQDPPKKRLYIQPKKTPRKEGAEIFIPNGPAKSQGGCHAGCFEKWPEHKPEKYLSPAQIAKYVKPIKGMKPTPAIEREKYNPPSMALKTMFTRCILQNTDFTVKGTNWMFCEPTYTKYLL